MHTTIKQKKSIYILSRGQDVLYLLNRKALLFYLKEVLKVEQKQGELIMTNLDSSGFIEFLSKRGVAA